MNNWSRNFLADLASVCLLIIFGASMYAMTTAAIVTANEYVELRTSPYRLIGMTCFLLIASVLCFLSYRRWRGRRFLWTAWAFLILSPLPLAQFGHFSRVSRSEIVSIRGVFFWPMEMRVDLRSATRIKFNCLDDKQKKEWLIESAAGNSYYAPNSDEEDSQHVIAKFLMEKGLTVSENCE